MTHFNHDWDTTKTPAVPVAVGDRYYAQDLNDDFNYMKHLPYEAFLQNRADGVVIAPASSYNPSTHVLSLVGGLAAKKITCTTLDDNEDFVLPPKTTSDLRYERVALLDTVITLPQDSTMRYIVATPTKRTLLERAKALVSEQWYCRSKYDGVITIQDTALTSDQILIGLALDDEYLLLQDGPKQCERSIHIKCWSGVNKISSSLVATLQAHYNTTISAITGNISMSDSSSVNGIDGGNFLNCDISAKVVSGTFEYCRISGEVLGDGNAAHTVLDHCEVLNVANSAKYTASNSKLMYANPPQSSSDLAISQGGFYINTASINTAKSIPSYYEKEGMNVKVLFKNGHNASSASDNMTINGVPVVSNQNGTLLPIPIHEIGSPAEYKVLDPNTTLEVYYTADYDGNGTPAFVVVGNPLVLSSFTYSIYANGYNDFVNNCELSDPESITLSTNSSNPTIMEYDGFITIEGGSQVQQSTTSMTIYVKPAGGTSYFSVGQSAHPYMSGAIYFGWGIAGVPVKKGDSVYASGNIGSRWARFYKKRDYSNR